MRKLLIVLQIFAPYLQVSEVLNVLSEPSEESEGRPKFISEDGVVLPFRVSADHDVDTSSRGDP